MKIHKWTDEERKKLVELRNSGKTFAELAAIFGVSKQSISQTYYKSLEQPKNYLDRDIIKRKTLAEWIKWNYGDIDTFCKHNKLQRRTVENILKAHNNPNYTFCELIMRQSPPYVDFLKLFEVTDNGN